MGTMLLLGVQTASVAGTSVVTTFSAKGTTQECGGSPVQQASTDSITYAIDFSAMLGPSDTIATPTVIVFGLSSDQLLVTSALVSHIAVIGKTVIMTIAHLEAGTTYRFSVVDVLGSGNIEDAWFRISCPF